MPVYLEFDFFFSKQIVLFIQYEPNFTFINPEDDYDYFNTKPFFKFESYLIIYVMMRGKN